MRKPRSDAILLNLPEEQQAKLADWLLSGVPYHEARVLVEKEFGVTVKSLDSFKCFWAAVCVPHLLARRRRAVSTAEQRAEEAEKNPAPFDAATLDALKEKAFELAQSPTSSLKDVKAVLGLLLKARSEDRADRELIFERTKWETEMAEKMLNEALRRRAEEIANSNMSNADKIAEMRKVAFKSVDELEASGSVKIPKA